MPGTTLPGSHLPGSPHHLGATPGCHHWVPPLSLTPGCLPWSHLVSPAWVSYGLSPAWVPPAHLVSPPLGLTPGCHTWASTHWSATHWASTTLVSCHLCSAWVSCLSLLSTAWVSLPGCHALGATLVLTLGLHHAWSAHLGAPATWVSHCLGLLPGCLAWLSPAWLPLHWCPLVSCLGATLPSLTWCHAWVPPGPHHLGLTWCSTSTAMPGLPCSAWVSCLGATHWVSRLSLHAPGATLGSTHLVHHHLSHHLGFTASLHCLGPLFTLDSPGCHAPGCHWVPRHWVPPGTPLSATALGATTLECHTPGSPAPVSTCLVPPPGPLPIVALLPGSHPWASCLGATLGATPGPAPHPGSCTLGATPPTGCSPTGSARTWCHPPGSHCAWVPPPAWASATWVPPAWCSLPAWVPPPLGACTGPPPPGVTHLGLHHCSLLPPGAPLPGPPAPGLLPGHPAASVLHLTWSLHHLGATPPGLPPALGLLPGSPLPPGPPAAWASTAT
ncbi:hypothetical protein GPJ56_007214 [Histomonas meleagridis]|nr:hypothetical protein GPJ56_007214 [Histomonas meleagridis]